MKLKPIPLACLAAIAVAGCGGGGGSDTPGQTATTAGQINVGYLQACIDANRNWQCDDGDSTVSVSASGSTSLNPAGGQYVLLETRDTDNQRTRLLISEAGNSSVTGLSTLRTLLRAAGKSEAQITSLVASLGANAASALEAGYAGAMQSNPQALSALSAYSSAVFQSASASATPAGASNTIGTTSTADVTWAGVAGSEEIRQLAAYGSTVLSNNESNRLYLFDASATVISSTQVDLIPPAEPLASAGHYGPVARFALAALDSAFSLMVDTVSAATAVSGGSEAGSPVTLAPGKGIAGIQVVNGGKDAYVLMNMLSGKYTAATCKGTSLGNEGLFKISLTSTASYRALTTAPACVHSGFSLVAADPNGAYPVAWDATSKRLWLLDGTTMAEKALIDVQFDSDKPPQALAVSPGGRYLAAAGYGRLAIVDMPNRRIVANLTGEWSNVSKLVFANGARKLLIASAHKVFTVNLDNALQLISQSSAAVSAQGEDLRGLVVSDDGDSYIAASDKKAYWNATRNGAALGTSTLPVGLKVQQIALARNKLVVIAQGSQDAQYKLYRIPVGLPSAPLPATTPLTVN